MKKICFVTNNQGKLKEIKELLTGKYEILSLSDIGCYKDIPEVQDTFEGNSLDKATFIWEKYHIDCFSDDSGLEVKALNNAPGIYSARYAGIPKNDENNIKLLLSNLADIVDRTACFRTVITLINSGKVRQFKGKIKGSILNENKGIDGFGYDPIFVPEGFSTTFAEMSLDQKNAISHRGQAIKRLMTYLQKNNE